MGWRLCLGYSTAGVCVESGGVHAARHAGCSIGVGLAMGQVGGHQGAEMGQRVVAA